MAEFQLSEATGAPLMTVLPMGAPHIVLPVPVRGSGCDASVPWICLNTDAPRGIPYESEAEHPESRIPMGEGAPGIQRPREPAFLDDALAAGLRASASYPNTLRPVGLEHRQSPKE